MGGGIRTRMGGGESVVLEEENVRQDLLDGTRDAAKKGRIPELIGSELDRLFEILTEPGRIVSVPPGGELIVTDDGAAESLLRSEADGGRAFRWIIFPVFLPTNAGSPQTPRVSGTRTSASSR